MIAEIGTIIGILAGISAIIIFITGKENIREIFRNKTSLIPGPYKEEIANKVVLNLLNDFGGPKEYDFENDESINHTIYGHYFLKFENYQSFIVVACTRPDGWYECHVCAPKLSFIEFKQNKNGWYLGSRSIAVLNAGSWGKPPNKIQVLQIGKNNFGVVIEHKENNQGIYIAYTMIFADFAGDFKEVFSEQTSYFEVDAPEPKPNWKAEIKIQTISNSSFFDILVLKTGSGIPNNENNQLYKFDGCSYKLSDFYK